MATVPPTVYRSQPALGADRRPWPFGYDEARYGPQPWGMFLVHPFKLDGVINREAAHERDR